MCIRHLPGTGAIESMMSMLRTDVIETMGATGHTITIQEIRITCIMTRFLKDGVSGARLLEATKAVIGPHDGGAAAVKTEVLLDTKDITRVLRTNPIRNGRPYLLIDSRTSEETTGGAAPGRGPAQQAVHCLLAALARRIQIIAPPVANGEGPIPGLDQRAEIARRTAEITRNGGVLERRKTEKQMKRSEAS